MNLAADPRHAAKLKEMEGLLLTQIRRLNNFYPMWNQPDDGPTPPPAPAPRPPEWKPE